jgi:hypothetical protein
VTIRKKFAATLAITATLALGLTACNNKPAAQTVAENVSTAADNFEVQRKIVGVNGLTNTIAFEVEGRCSINDQGHQLEVICKQGPNEFRKHMIGLSDNTFYVAEQLAAVDVSQYHTRIVIRPETVVPELSLDMGQQ